MDERGRDGACLLRGAIVSVVAMHQLLCGHLPATHGMSCGRVRITVRWTIVVALTTHGITSLPLHLMLLLVRGGVATNGRHRPLIIYNSCNFSFMFMH